VAAGLFGHADFRRLWLVGLVVCIVRWLELLVLALYAYQITSSAFIVAMLPMLRMVPLTLFGALLGVLAERFDRRRALVLLVVLPMSTSLALAALATLGQLAVWHLAVASFIGGIGWAADHPVRRMMIGDAVGTERVASALSVDTATNNASRMAGPMLGGFLLARYGIETVLWINTALYTVSLVAALRVVLVMPVTARGISLFASMREGFVWAAREPRLIGVLTITVIFNLFGWPFTSMVPVIATDSLHLDPAGVGLLAGFEGIGGFVGALLLVGFSRPAWYGRIYVGAIGLYVVMLMGFALSPNAVLAGFCLFACGFSGAGFAVMQVTLVYRATPPEMRARMLGVVSACIGTSPIGYFYVGVLADVLTPARGMVALGLQGVLALVLTRRYWSAALRL